VDDSISAIVLTFLQLYGLIRICQDFDRWADARRKRRSALSQAQVEDAAK